MERLTMRHRFAFATSVTKFGKSVRVLTYSLDDNIPCEKVAGLARSGTS